MQKIAAMHAPAHPLRLVLEIVPGASPVRGTITGPDGRPRDYVGWLALMAALEELHRTSSEPRPQR